MSNQNPMNQFNYGLALPAMMGLGMVVFALLLRGLVFTPIFWQRLLGVGLMILWSFGFSNYLKNRRSVQYSPRYLVWCLVVGACATMMGIASYQMACESVCMQKWIISSLNLSGAGLLFYGAWMHWSVR